VRLDVSVVIPAYNAEDTLGACLEALGAQSAPPDRYEVIVVDDGSDDGTVAVAREHGVRLVRQPNAGPAAARNTGARAARGKILLFTDADCAPAPDWIERMTAPFDDPEVAGAKGVYRTRQREWVARFVQQEYEERYARMVGQECIDFVDTYSAAYRRDIFLAHGGFDSLFPLPSVEDQEFSFRLARVGCWLAFVPDAVVFHRHDVSLIEYWRRKFGIGYWKVLLLRRHPQRAVRDSHTPQSLKLQIALLALLLPALAGSVRWPLARWLALALGGLFAVSGAPFVLRLVRRDPAIAAGAPFMLLWRAAALGLGLVAGIARFRRRLLGL